MKIAALIAANGLGHYKRLVGILARLQELCDELPQLTVLCEQWQTSRMRGWSKSQQLWTCGGEAVYGIMHPGVHWARSPDVYSDGRLCDWERRLADVAAVREADVVISDNCAGILAERPDAVLCGSFLWSDVLESAFGDCQFVRAFVEHERDLLDKHRPPMLCVKELVMPGVIEHTEAVALPWMCEIADSGSPTDRPARAAAAMIGGATGAADDIMKRALDALLLWDKCDLLLPGKFIEHIPPQAREHVAEFDFDDGGYAGCSVVVCRPGMGVITDCVANQVPMVVLHEPGNLELEHNSRRLAELGYAINVGPAPDGGAVVEAVESALSPQFASEIRTRFSSAKTNGLECAANWLLERAACRKSPAGNKVKKHE